METIQVNSWREFEEWLRNHKASATSAGKRLLFRGQSDSSWKLETTLDRKLGQIRLLDYFFRVLVMGKELGTFTEREWDLPAPNQVWELTKDSSLLKLFTTSEMHSVYQYFTYLRHLGVPSPLLDWTRSPYIAAFFAFWQADPGRTQEVSVYAYSDGSDHRMTMDSEPRVVAMGRYVKSHRRHWLQQAEYTICAAKTQPDTWWFQGHELAVAAGGQNSGSVCKVNLPCIERDAVLALLNEYTINEYSLFDSEDMLASYLARQHFS